MLEWKSCVDAVNSGRKQNNNNNTRLVCMGVDCSAISVRQSQMKRSAGVKKSKAHPNDHRSWEKLAKNKENVISMTNVVEII